MLKRRMINLLSIILVFSVLITACAAPPTPTVPPTATTPPTITPTNTAIPPTPTITPIPIQLTDGTHVWTLKSAVLDVTSTHKLTQGYYLLPGYKLLTLEFSNEDDGSLISLAFGKDMGGIIEFNSIKGFANLYVTDQNGEKWYAMVVGRTYLVIPVSENSSGFMLYAADLSPIAIEVNQ